MLPVFAPCAPFYRWVSRKFVVGESDVEETPESEVREVDRVISEVMEREGGREKFVGVMGFSQGARLVPGLLLRQKVEEQSHGTSNWHFKFGIMIGGPFPPISLTPSPSTSDYELLRDIPTVHAWGREDHVKPGCVDLYRVCDGDECFQMEFEGGHHLPLKDVEAKDLCDLVLAAWYAGGGRFGVGSEEKY
jgi:predicted esterase